MKESKNFIENIIDEDLASGLDQSLLKFRFPPEPNGFLHIGHVKAICVNFSLAKKYKAPVVLRFDDTNPVKEEQQYIDAIKKDISWLGFKWDEERFASDYFEQLYNWALELIKNGKAYVDSQSSTLMAEQKGTPTSPGENSIYRDRPIEENIRLFNEMRQGVYAEGKHVLRAKISMNANNMLLRDPVIYRVIKKEHPRTGSNWVVYPLYDWAHGESDYIEQISHSLCTLEFKPHRELYNWFLKQIADPNKLKPKQREFARLNLSYTVTSKRKLKNLIDQGHVTGWDDPRMPTVSGLRRRGYTPESLQSFVNTAGVAKRDNVIDVSLLEFCVRDHLNQVAPRVMAVLDPIKLNIINYPEGKDEILMGENNPEDESAGIREIPFSRDLYIEREDFREEANRKFFRLTLGKEVRLKNAYFITATSCEKDENGEITVIHCTYDPLTKSGMDTEESKRKVKGTLHWVSVKHAVKAEVRAYDRLFLDEAPDSHKDKDYMEFVNPNSLEVITAFVEPSLQTATIGERFQFQRLGYFCVDKDTSENKLVFNRTVPLRDSWTKMGE